MEAGNGGGLSRRTKEDWSRGWRASDCRTILELCT
jgi:hypothetical protein